MRTTVSHGHGNFSAVHDADPCVSDVCHVLAVGKKVRSEQIEPELSY